MNAFAFMLRHQREFWLYAGLSALAMTVLTKFVPQLNEQTFGLLDLVIYSSVFCAWSRLVYRQSGMQLRETNANEKWRNAIILFLYGLLMIAAYAILFTAVSLIFVLISAGSTGEANPSGITYFAIGALLGCALIVLVCFAPLMLALPGRALGYGTTLGESSRLSAGRRITIVVVMLTGGGISLLGVAINLGLLLLGVDSPIFDFVFSVVGNLISNIGVLYVADRLTHLYVAAAQANRTAATPTA